jgi:tetratricopeptide (TPR) repeat protein
MRLATANLRVSVRIVLTLCFDLIVLGCFAGSIAPGAAARQGFQDAKSRYEREPGNSEASWQFARACFDLAEFATNNAQRVDIAEQGIAACKQLVARQSYSAPGHYYLGMNLGQVAQTRGLNALKLVDEMEREFSLARNLDSSFDHAGPERNLGLLYRDAPSIISVGNRSKAKKHLMRAVELAPDYPENRLNLIEAFLKWNERNSAQNELQVLEKRLPEAHAAFSGPSWEANWADWDKRIREIRKKLEEPSKAIPSPSHKE